MNEFRPYSKADQIKSKRIKPTQRQLGDISPAVRHEVKERSNGICEVQKRCTGSRGVQLAHLIGRKQLIWKTTANDLRDACIDCHVWLDQTPDGIRHKRELVRLPFDDTEEGF